ncbi:MAG TPA: FAD-binding oxidoreductase [Chloroflexota bacterium]|nr:FAD-binding oxidoreductase [Chloroflexota bacterium]
MLVESWAMLARSLSYVYRPSSLDGILEVLEIAERSGRSIVPRGSGFSYGDTSLNAENIVLDMRRLNRILEWDPASGVVRAEPAVTIGQLWRHTLEDGWWPAVVPGTMFPTLGGCTSTNVHGKNHWRVGSFGEQLLGFELLLPDGRVLTCGPDEDDDVFGAAVGGLGMLGIILSLTLRLGRVQSGLLRVEERVAPSLRGMFALVDEYLHTADELIGWIDGFARDRSLGRGIVQAAFAVEDDPRASVTLRPEYQAPPDDLLGLIPRSVLWRGMKLGVNDGGMRLLNATRFALSSRRSGRSFAVPHAQFHFMLDFVPNWKRAFHPCGIAQYQAFVPRASAETVFAALLEESQRAGLVPYLAVFKRHRPDPFLLGYSVDGYSLALDYRVTPANRMRVQELLSRLSEDIVLPAGGRFYPAKDFGPEGGTLRSSLNPEAVAAYMAMKRRLDPHGVLQSDLFRRVFA